MGLREPVENGARKTDAAEGEWARDAGRGAMSGRAPRRRGSGCSSGATSAGANSARKAETPLPIATEIEEV